MKVLTWGGGRQKSETKEMALRDSIGSLLALKMVGGWPPVSAKYKEMDFL